MADYLNPQDLANAKVDAKTLGEAVNDKKIVKPRYGENYKSIPLLSADGDSAISKLKETIDIALAAGAGSAGWDASLVHYAGSTQADFNKKVTVSVESIADMLAIKNPKDGDVVCVKGYYAPTNLALAKPYKGGGLRIYVDSLKTEDDGFLCIKGWVLQVENNTVTPEQAGARGDEETDDYDALTRVLRSKSDVTKGSGFIVQLDEAVYTVNKPIEMYAGTQVIGSGFSRSIIRKKTASTTGITSRTNPQNQPFNYDVDCAVVFAAWNGWHGDIHLSDFKIEKEKVGGQDVGYALYMPFVMQSYFTNLFAEGGEYGIWCADIWMIDWTRVRVTAKGGWYIGTGTSNTFQSCWVTDVLAGYSAYRLNSMTYSTMISCAADRVGLEGSPANAVYHITNSDMKMIGCGAEVVHANNVIRIENSWIQCDNPSFRYTIVNNYNNPDWKGLFSVYGADSVFKISGGIVDASVGVNATFPVFVNDGTLNFEQVLWTGVGFPDDTTPNKISYGNNFAILNLLSFNGRSYIKTRSNTQTMAIKAVVTEGLLGNGGDIDFNNAKTYSGFNRGTASSTWFGAGFSVGSGTNVLQVATDGYAGGRLKFRASISDSGSPVFTPWASIWNTLNTTVDSNGFIKAASPIIKLFSDHIESNEEAAEQNPVYEKVGIGHYLIKNTLGFAKEGWWIEVPSDSNGNKICAVKCQVLENEDIEVKTFKRKFDVETASIIADEGSPIDIPSNMNGEKRWIDIRLNENPQKED